MKSKKILFATSEVYPFIKSGGLADVSYALVKESSKTHQIDTVLPLYNTIDRELYNITKESDFAITLGEHNYNIELYKTVYEDRLYYFIYEESLCGNMYGVDDDIRFAIFSRAIAHMVEIFGYRALHINDWLTALSALWIRELNLDTKILFTIHNLAYQGRFGYETLRKIGLDDRYGSFDELEFYGDINYIKAGIKYSDFITTVSANYAKEIMSDGYGLEGMLGEYSDKITGILNGIDSELYSPKSSPFLPKQYRVANSKLAQKRELLKDLPLKVATKPLFVFIGRLVEQKGLELLLQTLPQMLQEDINVLFVGEGQYSDRLQKIEAKNFYFYDGYSEEFSHRSYAAADFLLMPSLFEPCGLNQMIALSFGAIPVVTKVGGLVDSVKNYERFDETKPYGYGIMIDKHTPKSLMSSIKKSIKLYEDNTLYQTIANHNMKLDLSWGESAKKYNSIYKKLLK